jgi:predicted nucleotidyltransferase
MLFFRASILGHFQNWIILKVAEVTEIIKQKADPVRIVLFGSRARGDNTASSDYDILIVIKNVKNEREITKEIYKEMYTRGVDLDIELIAVDENRWNNDKERFDLSAHRFRGN